MLRYTISLLLLCNCLLIKAQTYHPFIDTNKVWSVVEGYSLFTYNTYYYKLKGDTTINNTAYKKMLSSTDSNLVSSWQYIAALREDSLQRVYISQYNQPEKQLYNFNLQVGDTLHYTQMCTLLVNAIDSIQLINGEYRKRILFFNSPNYQWIEGIGSEDGPLYIYVLGCDVDFNAELNCFTENDTLKFKSANFNSCYFSNVSLNENSKDKFYFSPNPANNFIYLNNTFQSKNLVITLNDLNGKAITIQTISKNSTIDISQLNNGVYVIHFFEKGKILQSQKLVVLKE